MDKWTTGPEPLRLDRPDPDAAIEPNALRWNSREGRFSFSRHSCGIVRVHEALGPGALVPDSPNPNELRALTQVLRQPPLG